MLERVLLVFPPAWRSEREAMTHYEALYMDLDHILADPNNKEHLRHAAEQECIAFGTGIDPVELPEVIRFIAKKGTVWLQYLPKGWYRCDR